MVVDLIRMLYRYNAWANTRILDTTAQLGPKELLAPAGTSFGSVRDALVHIMGAEWIWLARWQGASPSTLPDPSAFPDLYSIRIRWVQIEHATHEFVQEVNDTSLTRVIEYVNTQGERWAYPLWQQMIHQVNHGTQHRSEVATILTQLGHSPGWLDLLYFIDLKETDR